MNLNDCIAETVSLAEYCEDKETKDILLNHLKKLLDLQLREFKQTREEPSQTLDCKQCDFENEVGNTIKAGIVDILRCKACGYCNTVNT